MEITQISREQEKETAPYKLTDIYDFEDQVAKHKEGTKARKEGEKKLLDMYTAYNKWIGNKCFNETKVEL